MFACEVCNILGFYDALSSHKDCGQVHNITIFWAVIMKWVDILNI